MARSDNFDWSILFQPVVFAITFNFGNDPWMRFGRGGPGEVGRGRSETSLLFGQDCPRTGLFFVVNASISCAAMVSLHFCSSTSLLLGARRKTSKTLFFFSILSSYRERV